MVFEEYDADGVATTVVAPRWSPAMFCIGINDLWYVSLSWEFGVDEEPWIHLENDYGYQFDDSEQVALMRSRAGGGRNVMKEQLNPPRQSWETAEHESTQTQYKSQFKK